MVPRLFTKRRGERVILASKIFHAGKNFTILKPTFELNFN